MSGVEQVIADLAARFGPGYSNGVYAILLHGSLPAHFDKKCWSEWAFKPADSAFEWAHDRGLIAPYKLSSKWQFTELGEAVARRVQSAEKTA